MILIHFIFDELAEIAERTVFFHAMLFLKEIAAVIDRHLAGALGVHSLPHVSHTVIDDVRGGKTRVGAVVRLAEPVRLDELAKVFEPHAIPEVFVHNAELLVPAPVAAARDSGALKRRLDHLQSDCHLFGLGPVAGGIT